MERVAQIGTIEALDTLERIAYAKLAELIDGNHLDDAGKVVDVLREVGIV